MGIRKPLHPQQRGSNKAYLAPACFTMTKDNKDVFLKVLIEVKVPDGYASNISRHVHMKERSIWDLKSHDHHILMQQLLPIAAHRALPKNVVEALIEFTNFFRQLCSKVNVQSDLEHIQERIVHTLFHFEKIFPMSFFDVMEHLPIHLADEALVVGAVQFRWMYPIEMYLLTLKCYVRNRAHPEAAIAKGRLMEECMTFCARYLNEVETKLTCPTRNDDGGSDYGRPLNKGVKIRLDEVTWTQDPIDSDQHVVVNVTVRGLFDMHSKDSSHTPTIVPHVELYAPQQLDETVFMNDEDVGWVREGVDGVTVDTNVEEVDDPPENEMGE
ncbi:hypothetical protein ACFX13_024504 [Malus domestica]